MKRRRGARWSHCIPAGLLVRSRLGDPDYFGERALLGSEIRSASITALEDPMSCNGQPRVPAHGLKRAGHGAVENGKGNFPGDDARHQELVQVVQSQVSAHTRQGPCLDYLKDRISLQDPEVCVRTLLTQLSLELKEDTNLTFRDLESEPKGNMCVRRVSSCLLGSFACSGKTTLTGSPGKGLYV